MGPSRSDRPYGAFLHPDAPVPDATQVVAPARRARAWRRGVAGARRTLVSRPPLWLTFVVLWAVLFAQGLANPVKTPLSLRDVDREAARVVASATPRPAAAIGFYEQVRPSVVSVEAKVVTDDGRLADALGAGVILDTGGTILTSLHVIQRAQQITVVFADGTRSPAQLVGSAIDRDVAVLKALRTPAEVVPATIGDPHALRIGEDVYAIGNPIGLTGSLTKGIVSGLERTFSARNLPKPVTGMIQFDAAVNPGSSGGPLINGSGDVVAIVTGITNPSGAEAFAGIGFAVPIDEAAGAAGAPVD